MESVRKDIEDVYSQLKGCFRIFAFQLHKKSQVDNVVLTGMACCRVQDDDEGETIEVNAASGAA
jgi:hypothetical protein